MGEYWNDPDGLAQHLDDVLPPGRDDINNMDADDPLTQAAVALANDPPPSLSFEAMARIQAKMLATNDAIHNTTTTPKQPSRTRRILRLTQGVLTAAASMVIVLFFVTPMVMDSVPGDALYPVKRSIEQVQLDTVEIRGADAAELHLKLAERRVREAMSLVDAGEFDPELVESSVDGLIAAAMAVEVSEGGTVPQGLIADTVQVNALLDYVLAKANFSDNISQDELVAASMQVTNARTSGQLLLPSVVPATRENEASNNPPEPTVMVPVPVVETAIPPLPPPQADEDTSPTEPPPASEITVPTEAPIVEIIVETTAEITPEMTSAVTPEVVVEFGVIVANGVVNMRSGPGTDYEIIAALRPNMQVEILGESDDESWVNVRLLDDGEGWVAAFLIGDEPVTRTQPGCNGASCDPVGNPADPLDPAPGDANTGNNGNTNPGDFGCDQPGNACNAPGQTGETPDNIGNNPPPAGPPNPPPNGPPEDPTDNSGGNPAGGRP